ncbi:MAG: M1 family metallopeptidase [Gilvibacter sp.]
MKYLLLGLFLATTNSFGQQYSKADSIRGGITNERVWWDVTHYDLDVQVDIDSKFFRGTNTIEYNVLVPAQVMQIDLQAPMSLDKAVQNGQELAISAKGMFHYIQLQKDQVKGNTEEITLYFSGNPKEAINAPWDGGVVWSQDSNGKPFIATANQSIGSSIWWPCKDHPYDEPNKGVNLSVTTPKDLMDVSNGRLTGVDSTATTKTWHWEVKSPINLYGININIGDYVHFGEKYKGEKGPLTMDYFVLREDLDKAKEQFKQAPKMMQAFEHWFGPYPFYEDGFKLVQVPYLGMEHQSSVTYGNQYQNGYLGRDLSQSGWGLKFDFIIIHEAGHEWFANNITNKDVADMWIHEGFTAYSENLYLDYHFGKEASAAYVIGTRQIIQNDRPIIGPYGVDANGSNDMYYKGANILHTLRQLLEDDEKWRSILRKMNSEFYHKTVSSKDVEDFLSRETRIDLTAFFNQYLRTATIPTIEYLAEGNTLKYRYVNVVDDFDMPVIVMVNGNEHWIFPNADWKQYTSAEPIDSVEIKKDFLVDFIKN